MPVFQYKCRKCGSVFEHLINDKLKEEGLACISCKSWDVEKCDNFQFKTSCDEENHGKKNCPHCKKNK